MNNSESTCNLENAENNEDAHQNLSNSQSTQRLSISTLSINISQSASTRLKQINKNTKNWRITMLPALLCFYSLVKEIKVGEPYLFKYQTEYLNLTADQITGVIYPYTPYAYMTALVPIFLFTDLFLYKPTMFVEIIGQIVFRSTLVFGGSVISQIIGQISYGIASASEIAFFSYIYARLEKEQFRSLTSWTRAGTMAGRTTGYLFAQFLVLSHLRDLRTLNIIALIMPCFVLIICFILPRVHWKVMVTRMLEAKSNKIHNINSSEKKYIPLNYRQYLHFRTRRLHSEFIKIYSVGHIRKWSVWWAMTTCMSLQVALFSQTLWGEVQKGENGQNPFNGFAEATYTATATLAILALNAFPLDWDKWGEIALVLISSIDALMLIIYANTESIWIMYLCYIGYRSLYQVMITIAQWNIAKKMLCESYGLVFGVNSFIALCLQSLLTLVVTDERGFGLNVRQQYLIYGFMHFVIALIFLLSVIFTVVGYCYRKCISKRTSKISSSNISNTFGNQQLSTADLTSKEDLENDYHESTDSSASTPSNTITTNSCEHIRQR
uniref:Reduced folate carrier n=1 Tax=Meloidogyne incognita TaxID=6306 RepID=A0A914L7V7_MELIC